MTISSETVAAKVVRYNYQGKGEAVIVGTLPGTVLADVSGDVVAGESRLLEFNVTTGFVHPAGESTDLRSEKALLLVNGQKSGELLGVTFALTRSHKK